MAAEPADVGRPEEPAAAPRAALIGRLVRNTVTLASLLLLLVVAVQWAMGRGLDGLVLRLPGGAPNQARFVTLRGGAISFFSQKASQPADGTWRAVVESPGAVNVESGGGVVASIQTTYITSPSRWLLWFTSLDSSGFTVMFRTPAGRTGTCTAAFRAFVVPPWMVAAASAALPALWLRRRLALRRDLRRAAGGLCRACGYDLRASPGRCPECGQIPITA